MRLIVIEAPGKIETVKRSARAVWGSDIAVLATGCYIWTFPNKEIGIDPVSLRPNADEQTSKGKFFEKQLQTLASKNGTSGWDDTILLTDPDREGEGIAAQAQLLIKKYFPTVGFKRLYAHDLTPDGLKSADTRKEPHLGMVEAHTARKVLDRLLPLCVAHNLHRDGDFVGMGRLQTAAIRVMKDKSLQWKRFLLEGRWSTVEGSYHVREYADNSALLHAKLEALKVFGAYTNGPKKEMIKTIQAPPPHSAFTAMISLIDVRPEETMKALQEGYIQGRLSYPRTDQAVLGSYAQRSIASLADTLHLGHRLRPGWFHETSELTPQAWVQGAHPALHPSANWTPSTTEPSNLNERVEAEVAARALASLMVPAVVQRKVVSLCTQDGDWFDAVQDTIVDPGWTVAYTRMGLSNPLIPDIKFGKRFPYVRDQLPTPAHIVEWLHDEHLGRPSTLSTLPTKLQSLGLASAACIPTRYAEKQLQEIEKVMPAYTYAAFTKVMEEGLSHLLGHPEDYTSVIKSLLVQSGTDIIGLPTAIANAKPVDLNDPDDTSLNDFGM